MTRPRQVEFVISLIWSGHGLMLRGILSEQTGVRYNKLDRVVNFIISVKRSEQDLKLRGILNEQTGSIRPKKAIQQN